MAEVDEVQNKMRALQHQVRLNANDTMEYLAEMQQWEKDIRRKDLSLQESKPTSSLSVTNKFPVRGSNGMEKATGNCTGKCSKSKASNAAKNAKSQRIRSSDYKAWDKFDVDQICADMDYETAPASEDDERCGSECDCDEQEKSTVDIEKAAKQKRAEFEKGLGNQYFEKGNFAEAVQYYTNAINYDSTNAVYFSNRAMANLKLKKSKNAEEDCNAALELDPKMVKAYHRRATARLSQKNITGAKSDFQKLLMMEPKNKEAQEKLQIIKQWEAKQSPSSAQKETALPETSPSAKRLAVAPSSSNMITQVSSKSNLPNNQKDGRVIVKPLEKPLLPDGSSILRKIPIREVTNAKPDVEVPSKTAAVVQSGAPSGPMIREVITPANSSRNELPSQEILTASIVKPEVVRPTQTVKLTKEISPVAHKFLPPASAQQFFLTCEKLFENPKAAGDYLKLVDPSSYRKMIGQNMEQETFLTIFRGSVQLFSRDEGGIAFAHLYSLASLPRFSFFAHCIPKEEKNDLEKQLKNQLEILSEKRNDLLLLAEKFAIKL